VQAPYPRTPALQQPRKGPRCLALTWSQGFFLLGGDGVSHLLSPGGDQGYLIEVTQIRFQGP
jgi:hypothetical protein